MKKITLSKPYITKEPDNSLRLNCDFYFDSEAENTQTLYFKYEGIEEKYIVDEVLDPFLFAVFPYCLKHQVDIVCNYKITRNAYISIVEHLIPTLSANISFYHHIKLISEYMDITFNNYPNRITATGASTGVDSLYTILKSEYEPHFSKIDMMINMNLGYFFYESAFQEQNARSRFLANSLNKRYAVITSNLDEFYKDHNSFSHEFRKYGAVFGICKLVKYYYTAAGREIRYFAFNGQEEHYFHYESQVVNDENLKIRIIAEDVSRDQRVRYIAQFPITYNILNVCYGNNDKKVNCSHCEKCIDTMLSLYSFGLLERYANVFDIKRFYKNINRIYAYAIISYIWMKDTFFKRVKELKKMNKRAFFFGYFIAIGWLMERPLHHVYLYILQNEKLKRVFYPISFITKRREGDYKFFF